MYPRWAGYLLTVGFLAVVAVLAFLVGWLSGNLG